jgi:hypothetical protein
MTGKQIAMHVKIYKKFPTVENVRQVIPLEMNFFVDTAFGYSNNQREATLLQNVSSKI